MFNKVACYLPCYSGEDNQDILKDHDSTISIVGMHIRNIRFADDIDLARFLMEISREKSKNLVNDPYPNKCNSKTLTISMYGKKEE